MYNQNLQPNPPPQPVQPIPPAAPPRPEKSWPPFMGMLSILTVIFPFVFFCILCLIIYWVGSQVGFEAERLTDQHYITMGAGVIIMICGSTVVSIVGIVIGLGALFGKTANKVLGIIGLLLNVFMMLAILCGFAIYFFL